MTAPVSPADYDPETTPAVVLAGRAWPIPELVWRDLKKCRRELLELNDRINAAIAAAPAPEGEDAEARSARQFQVLEQVFHGLDNDDFDRLVMGVIHAGLAAAHPGLKREELDGWPMGEAERQLAWLTVRRQSGLFTFTPRGEPEPDPGETAGAA